jgi:hypothetical protein
MASIRRRSQSAKNLGRNSRSLFPHLPVDGPDEHLFAAGRTDPVDVAVGHVVVLGDASLGELAEELVEGAVDVGLPWRHGLDLPGLVLLKHGHVEHDRVVAVDDPVGNGLALHAL